MSTADERVVASLACPIDPKKGLDREIVSISTFYLDRYLSMNYVDKQVRNRQWQIIHLAIIDYASDVVARDKG